MDWSAVLAKIAGLVLLAWTVWSIIKHFRERSAAVKSGRQEPQSISEQILNNLLLYLWLVFMLVFSVGMIVNN
jgi:glycerol uptake facilitator-like aquaporin